MSIKSFVSDIDDSLSQTDGGAASQELTESTGPVLAELNRTNNFGETISETKTALGIPKSVFINSQNTMLVQSLFLETALKRPQLAVYSLSDVDKEYEGKFYPSLYRLYLAEQDLTEFLFAESHLYNYAHWEKISNSSWFKPHLDRWRRDLNLQITARALQSVLKEAQSDSKNSFQANRILVDRLSQEDLQKSSKRKPKSADPVSVSDEILADLKRLKEE